MTSNNLFIQLIYNFLDYRGLNYLKYFEGFLTFQTPRYLRTLRHATSLQKYWFIVRLVFSI